MSAFTGTIDGNLTKDPELRFTPNGVAVVNFTVAHTPRTFDDNAKEWKDAGDTVFVRVTAWRALAENIASSLAKGVNVLVTGAVKQSSYVNKEDVKLTSLEMTADTVGVSLARQTVPSIDKSSATNGGGGNRGGNSAPRSAPQSAAASNDPWGNAGSSDSGFADEPPF